ncbi:MAG: adenylate/guanylate cyclase domain-containing protein [Desulfobulbus sp.]|nr:adenylate/guanylate cyclase domain-containing protein [Desulfobulbus sp.]
MSNRVCVTCFTDLQGSTSMTEQMGNEVFGVFRSEYLKIGKILSDNLNGNYIKNIGDSHLITFDDPIVSLRFATHLQQYYQPQSNFCTHELNSRIGLFLGVVDDCSGDVFGSGVNQGARVEGLCPPKEVWVNNDFHNAVLRVWGQHKTSKYFSSKGDYELKGILQPPKQELFCFNWNEYSKDNPDDSLAKSILDHLKDASVVASNLKLQDISSLSTIIWPVVPRDSVNAIHRSQLEMIRLLTILGWSVHVLIADCGVTKSFTKDYVNSFKSSIEDYANKRGMKNFEFSFMSDLYKPKCNNCDILHKHFQSVISSLTFQNLLDFNHKEYADDVKEAVKKAAALDFLHPALTISSVMYLCDNKPSKCIVVVGHDEHIQWEKVNLSIPQTREKFGVLFNPVIKKKEGKQARQTSNWPMFLNKEAVVLAMEEYPSLEEWFIKLHLFVPNFPSKFVQINDIRIIPTDWSPNKGLPENIDKHFLAQEVFDKILSV